MDWNGHGVCGFSANWHRFCEIFHNLHVTTHCRGLVPMNANTRFTVSVFAAFFAETVCCCRSIAPRLDHSSSFSCECAVSVGGMMIAEKVDVGLAAGATANKVLQSCG
jgi:hypothetical protein